MLLNLVASGRFAEIVRAWPDRCGIAQAAFDESLFVNQIESDGSVIAVAASLDTYVSSGLLLLHDVQATELTTYVLFAADIDDGEAMTCALAVCRNAGVITDDKKATRTLGRVSPTTALHDTIAMVRNWVNVSDIDSLMLQETLLKIEQGARFRPPRNHPQRDWWLQARDLPRPFPG